MKRIFLLFICFLAVFGVVFPVFAFELDLHGGDRFLKIDVEEDDVTFDFDNSGIYAAITVSF